LPGARTAANHPPGLSLRERWTQLSDRGRALLVVGAIGFVLAAGALATSLGGSDSAAAEPGFDKPPSGVTVGYWMGRFFGAKDGSSGRVNWQCDDADYDGDTNHIVSDCNPVTVAEWTGAMVQEGMEEGSTVHSDGTVSVPDTGPGGLWDNTNYRVVVTSNEDGLVRLAAISPASPSCETGDSCR
jgi:hypothetical protein